MKIKWREHELLFVSLFAAIKMAGFIWEMSILSQEMQAHYQAHYIRNNVVFDYTRNVLLPQLGSVLVLYLGYLWINKFAVPLLRQLFLRGKFTTIIAKNGLVILHLLTVSYLFALAINIASYYAHPHFLNYGGFNILSWLGYNDHPLTNLFYGWDRALVIWALYLLVASIREAVIYYLEKSGHRRDYRILITNQFTTFLIIYFSILALLITFNLVNDIAASAYVSFIPSVMLVGWANLYIVFPSQENKLIRKGNFRFLHSRLSIRLLVSTLVCTLPFVVLYAKLSYSENLFLLLLGWWALQLMVVTPLSVVLYRQWKDKILQVRGMEKELVKSKANLQFLRSQINPHFLFNSLNTLYGTALLENSELTAEGIQKLGDMMRFMLHENNLDFIPMSREIEYLKNYISLQKLRTQSSSKIVIEACIPDKHPHYFIVPMLLIPFVENAFKHGISTQERSWIKINLVCDEKAIRFEVRNSIHQRELNNAGQENSGIGLANVKERLTLLYPNRHTLHVGREADEFVVSLTLLPDAQANFLMGDKKAVNHF